MAVDRNIRILTVDDYQTMLRITQKLLRQLGFVNIDEATDGTMALQKLREQKYDLIFSDWNMDEMSGIELLQAVRGDSALRHIPFIMITAENKKENLVAAMKAGVSNYIVKPYTADTLRAKLTSVLGAL